MFHFTTWYNNCDEIKIKELEKREKGKELTESHSVLSSSPLNFCEFLVQIGFFCYSYYFFVSLL